MVKWPSTIAAPPKVQCAPITVLPATPQQAEAELAQLGLYDLPEIQESFVRTETGNIREAALILENIVCAACIWLNERHIAGLPGVLSVEINYATRRARVRWDNSRIQLSAILKAVSDIGYIAHPFDPGRSDDIYKRVLTWRLYKGDGRQFTVTWLKRRVARFVFGVDGSDPPIHETYGVGVAFVGGNVVNITLPPGTDILLAETLAYLVKTGTLELPFQYIFNVLVEGS